MFEAIFENDNGKKFVFGPRGNNWFGMDVGSGLEVTLGKSQGFGQLGETVQTQALSGRTIDVTGEFFGPIVSRKQELRRVCGPLATGRLVFQGTHQIRVWVRAAPSFSAVRDNGLFKMQFFAPFPFFSCVEESFYQLMGLVSGFRFPVNYASAHHFGLRSQERYVNVYNSGDVKIHFRLVLRSAGTSTDPVVTDLKTRAFLKISGQLKDGEFVTVFRDQQNVLRAELTSGSQVTDVISWIQEDSSLFWLEPGDNLISASDGEGGAALTATISFHPAVGAIYET